MSDQSSRPELSSPPTLDVGSRSERAVTSDGRRVAYYRCRCLVLEATVESLQRRLDRTEAELETVVEQYERILQDRGAEGRVVAASREGRSEE